VATLHVAARSVRFHTQGRFTCEFAEELARTTALYAVIE